MIPSEGKLLTAEQSVRLAVMGAADRQKLIAAIAAGLRKSTTSRRPGGDSPYAFYSRPQPG